MIINELKNYWINNSKQQPLYKLSATMWPSPDYRKRIHMLSQHDKYFAPRRNNRLICRLSSKDKNEKTRVLYSSLPFFPKAKNKNKHRQVFWLIRLSAPSRYPISNSGKWFQTTLLWTYSCGYSSGFTPDSLLIP